MKGQKGIYILAPIVRKTAEPVEGRVTTTVDGRISRIAGFRTATVFDVAQTDGEPLPEALEHNATEGGNDLLPKLEAATRAFGVELVYQTIPGHAEGYSKGGFVAVEQSQPTAAKCGTLAYELTHELLHWNGAEKGTKQQRELEAEATAYVVLSHFGMASGSRFYLTSYGITGEMLQAFMQLIAATARKIIQRIEGAEEGSEAEEEAALPLAA